MDGKSGLNNNLILLIPDILHACPKGQNWNRDQVEVPENGIDIEFISVSPIDRVKHRFNGDRAKDVHAVPLVPGVPFL